MPVKSKLRLVAPDHQSRSVKANQLVLARTMPPRQRNGELRQREYVPRQRRRCDIGVRISAAAARLIVQARAAQ